jgi:UDP-2-acetamido-3-amino-2,3-dideoxy-glucuronate N-acetyltransferase
MPDARKVCRVGVVGCGYWGKNIVRNFAELGALAAVSDTDQAVMSSLSRDFSVPGRTLDDLLADGSIDAVAFASPASRHAEHAKAALRAGKHVFVEKPLALTVEEGIGVAALARQTGLTFMVGHLLRYHPAVVTLIDAVKAGRLGSIRHLNARRLGFGKLRTEEDVLWSFSPHDLSVILAVVEEMPTHVMVEGASVLRGTGVDIATIHLRFPRGVSASVLVSWLNPFKEQKFSIIGSEAHAVFDDMAQWPDKLVIYDHKVEYRDGRPVAVSAKPERITSPQREPLREECAHFLECIRTGREPFTSASEALRVLSVLDAASRSAVAGIPTVPVALDQML